MLSESRLSGLDSKTASQNQFRLKSNCLLIIRDIPIHHPLKKGEGLLGYLRKRLDDMG